MRKRRMLSVSALALALALSGCSGAQPAVVNKEESKTNKIEQTSEVTPEKTSEETSKKPEEKITEPEKSLENTGKDTSENETEDTSKAQEESSSEEEGFSVAIDAEHFPDEVFRKRIFFFDKNENGMLEEKEVKDVRCFNLTGDTDFKNAQTGLGIKDLKGIEYFTELRELYCSHNQLTALDVSALSKLETLDCNSNRLLCLNVSGLSELECLYCSNNQLIELDVSDLSELHQLKCSNNQLTELKTPLYLYNLDCHSNRLSSLEVSGFGMIALECYDNRLTSLELSILNIEHIGCHYNPLTSISVSYSPFYEGHPHTITIDSGVEVIEENDTKWDINYIPTISGAEKDPITGAYLLPDGVYWYEHVDDIIGIEMSKARGQSWHFAHRVENGFLMIEGELAGLKNEGRMLLPLADGAKLQGGEFRGLWEDFKDLFPNDVELAGLSFHSFWDCTEEEFNQLMGSLIVTVKDGKVVSAVKAFYYNFDGDWIDYAVPEIDPETNATVYPDGLYITGACLEAEQMKEETGLGLASYEYDSLKVENGFLSFNGYLQSSCGDGHVKLPLSEELKDFYSNNAFDPKYFQLGMVIKIENGCVVAVEGCIDGL